MCVQLMKNNKRVKVIMGHHILTQNLPKLHNRKSVSTKWYLLLKLQAVLARLTLNMAALSKVFLYIK